MKEPYQNLARLVGRILAKRWMKRVAVTHDKSSDEPVTGIREHDRPPTQGDLLNPGQKHGKCNDGSV